MNFEKPTKKFKKPLETLILVFIFNYHNLINYNNYSRFVLFIKQLFLSKIWPFKHFFKNLSCHLTINY